MNADVQLKQTHHRQALQFRSLQSFLESDVPVLQVKCSHCDSSFFLSILSFFLSVHAAHTGRDLQGDIRLW